MMVTLGYAMDDAYLSALFKKFDQDGDGDISPAEFDDMGRFLGILDPAAATAPTPAAAVAPDRSTEPTPAAAATDAGDVGKEAKDSRGDGSRAPSADDSSASQMPEGLSQMQQMAWRKQHGVKKEKKKKEKKGKKKKNRPKGDDAGMPEGLSKMQQIAWRKTHDAQAATK